MLSNANQADAGITAILRQHHASRRLGIPTISTIVGPLPSLHALLIGSNQSTDINISGSGNQVVLSDPNDWFPFWMERLLVNVELGSLLLQQLCEHQASHILGSAGILELTLLAERKTIPNVGDLDLLVKKLYELAILKELISVDSVLDAIASTNDQSDSMLIIEFFVYLMTIVPESKRPSLVFMITESEHISVVFKTAAQIALAIPTLPIVCCLDQSIWSIINQHYPCDRSFSIACENLIFLSARESDDYSRLSSELIDSPFNSRQEQILYEHLQRIDETHDLFVPNADPGFKFGNRAAEIDLLCEKLRIAVEIDGYHHFREPDRYRRDRRKDYLMQKHGYLVLRFLAEDVDTEIEPILSRILQAVRLRSLRTDAVYPVC